MYYNNVLFLNCALNITSIGQAKQLSTHINIHQQLPQKNVKKKCINIKKNIFRGNELQ